MQGQTINGYTLQRRLGEGGMAEVWYAENEIGKPAAVKVLNENLSRNTQIVERFHNEALVMVKLDHPNIRQVYGYGYIGNRHCIIMEYLDGDDLDALLRSGKHFTDEELRRWWNQTVDALNYTHAMDIVHRDIKPSNLFLDKKGNIKLLDFGIAKVKESMSMTRTGMTMGTLMYMSPEQVKDPKRVGVKSDVYSLAVSFVHLLTGKPIYDSDTSSEYDIQVSIVTQPVDLSAVPVVWQSFLKPYLEKDPEKRPALRHFEETAQTAPEAIPTIIQPETTPSTEPTRVADSSSEAPHSGSAPLSPEPQDKPKSKVGLWIGLGVAAVAVIVLLVLLIKPKREDDFERYRARVEKQVEDSFAMAKAQEQAEMEAQAKAETEAKSQAEAELKAKVEAEDKAQTELEKKQAEEAKKPGVLKGVVKDINNVLLPFVSLTLSQGNKTIKRVETDFDGNYEFAFIPPGTYDLSASFVGYNSYELKNVVFQPNKTIVWDITLTEGSLGLGKTTVNYNGSNAKVVNNNALTAQEAFEKGKAYFDDHNDKQAVEWFRKAAEMDHTEAQLYLGDYYLVMEENVDEAVKWLKKAANKGDADAQWGLGMIYGEEKENYTEAVKWYRKAANQGHSEAQLNLGDMYYNGWGVAKDDAEALKWYKKAENQGNVFATSKIKAIENK